MLQVIREDFLHDSEVRARQSLEMQGFFLYPDAHITPALKAYDENLDVWRNERNGRYRIVDHTCHTIMEFPWHELTDAKVEHIKRIDVRNGYRAAAVMEQADLKREHEEQRRMEDMAYNLGKDTVKLVREHAYYGR